MSLKFILFHFKKSNQGVEVRQGPLPTVPPPPPGPPVNHVAKQPEAPACPPPSHPPPVAMPYNFFELVFTFQNRFERCQRKFQCVSPFIIYVRRVESCHFNPFQSNAGRFRRPRLCLRPVCPRAVNRWFLLPVAVTTGLRFRVLVCK